MNNGRILVVEDEKDIRDGLCELLCRCLSYNWDKLEETQ